MNGSIPARPTKCCASVQLIEAPNLQVGIYKKCSEVGRKPKSQRDGRSTLFTLPGPLRARLKLGGL